VVDTDRDPGTVIGQVIDSVGNGFAVGLTGEVVSGHLDWFALRVPFFAALPIPSDEVLLLGSTLITGSPLVRSSVASALR